MRKVIIDVKVKAAGIRDKTETDHRNMRTSGSGVQSLLVCSGLLLLGPLAESGVFGLKSVQIRVPEAVRIGDSAKLACDYDLEQAALYSIKWYRSHEEFYRFVPKESPPTRVFPLQGIHVDLSQSNAREVTLRDVQRDLTGFYKCEISADAPLFHTDIKSALMIVADLPDDNPILTTEKLKYSLGEKIRANCSSHASYPAANLTWFVNGQQISPSEHVTVSVSLHLEVGGLESARTSLQLEASTSIFMEGRLRLRCLATMFTLYRRTEEVELHEDTPQISPVMGPTAPHSLDSGTRSEAPTKLLAVLCTTLVLVFTAR